MKRRYAKTTTLSLLVFLVLFGSALSLQARSLDEIKASGELRVCAWPFRTYTLKEFDEKSCLLCMAPPDCRGNCRVKGLFIEDLRVFAQSLGENVEVNFMRLQTWDEQFHNAEGKTVKEAAYTPALLVTGTCDMYPAMAAEVKWRQNKLDFVGTAAQRDMILVHQARQGYIRTAADLAGKTAGIIHGVGYQEWVEEQNRTVYAHNLIRIKLFDGVTERDSALASGEIDFIFQAGTIALFRIRHDPAYQHYVARFAIGKWNINGWPFRKDDKDLQAAAKVFMEAQRADPDSELNHIWQDHLGMSMIHFIELMSQTQ